MCASLKPELLEVFYSYTEFSNTMAINYAINHRQSDSQIIHRLS